MGDLGKCGDGSNGVPGIGCGEPFVWEGEKYRCVDCGVYLHAKCAKEHWKRSGADVASLREEVERLTQERARWESREEDLTKRRLMAETALDEARASLAGVMEERAGYKDEADRLAREWKRSDAEVERVRAALVDTREALLRTSKAADAAEAECARLRAEAGTAEARGVAAGVEAAAVMLEKRIGHSINTGLIMGIRAFAAPIPKEEAPGDEDDLPESELCPRCHGEGTEHDASTGSDIDCRACHGTGRSPSTPTPNKEK